MSKRCQVITDDKDNVSLCHLLFTVVFFNISEMNDPVVRENVARSRLRDASVDVAIH